MQTRTDLPSTTIAFSLLCIIVLLVVPTGTSAATQTPQPRLEVPLFIGCLPKAEKEGKECNFQNGEKGVCKSGECLKPLKEATPEEKEAAKALVDMCTATPQKCYDYRNSDQCDEACRKKMDDYVGEILNKQTARPDPLKSLDTDPAPQPMPGASPTPPEGREYTFESNTGQQQPAAPQEPGSQAQPVKPPKRAKNLTPGTEYTGIGGVLPQTGQPFYLGGTDWYTPPLSGIPDLPPFSSLPYNPTTFAPPAPVSPVSHTVQPNQNPGAGVGPTGQSVGQPAQNPSQNKVADLFNNMIMKASDFWKAFSGETTDPFGFTDLDSTTGTYEAPVELESSLAEYTEIGGPAGPSLATGFGTLQESSDSSANEASLPNTNTDSDTDTISTSPTTAGNPREIPGATEERADTNSNQPGSQEPAPQNLRDVVQGMTGIGQSLQSESEAQLENQTLRESLTHTQEALTQLQERASELERQLATNQQREIAEVQKLTQELQNLTKATEQRMTEAQTPGQKLAIAQQFLDAAGSAIDAIAYLEKSLQQSEKLPPTQGGLIIEKLSQGVQNIGNTLNSWWQASVRASQAVSSWIGGLFRGLF